MARTFRRRGAVAWAALLVVGPLSGAREVSLPSIAGQIASTAPGRLTPDGLVFGVGGACAVRLPLPRAETLELEYRSSGQILLSWSSGKGEAVPDAHEPPWHHEVLKPGVGRITLELRTTPNWDPSRLPFLVFEGTGTVVLERLWVRTAPEGTDAWLHGRDEALRWAPLRVGHTTINLLGPPVWRASTDLLLYEVLGGAFLVLAVGGALAWLVVRRRWRPAPFLAAVGITLTLAGNGLFLARVWPVLALRPLADPAARLRENFHLRPELGALAALALESIRLDETVGVQTWADDWFAWETLCFHLAPRRCVQVAPGASAFEGLPGTDGLVAEQIDVLVYLDAGVPPLPGFSRLAALNSNAWVARRR